MSIELKRQTSYLKELYISYLTRYTSFYAETEIQSKSFSFYYEKLIGEVVLYMEKSFKEEDLNDGKVEFSFEDFSCNIDSSVLSFLLDRYSLNGIVYLNPKNKRARFHVENSIIKKAEHLEEVIPVKKNEVFKKTVAVNKMFIGFSLLKAYHILNAAGVDLKKSDLEICVETIKKEDSFSEDFINAICVKLILSDSINGLARAEIFAEAFGATLDLSQFNTKKDMILN